MNSVLPRVILIFAVLSALIIGGALGFMACEELTFGDALYLTIVTVSTVGYGDIHPVTTGGKVLAVVLIITGVGIFLTVVSNWTQLLLHRRQERIRRERINMLVGLFFSELGTKLLELLSSFDPTLDENRENLLINPSWSNQDFTRLNQQLENHAYKISPERVEIEPVRDFLKEKSDLLLRLLENPNLLEHESFTELLRAILHLKEELVSRPESLKLPDPDLAHLANDSERAYSLLSKQWISYMHYLRNSYPYLFSFALRTNPFARGQSTIVT